MRAHTLSAIVLGAMLVSVWPAAPAQAAATLHTFVGKANGNDANATLAESCNIAQPCLSLSTAMTNTLAGGTITILDEYDVVTSTLTVTQSMTIEGRPGVNAVIRLAAAAALVIQPGPSDIVTLRNVAVLKLSPTASSGIVFNRGMALILDSVWIKGHPSFGLLFQPDTAAGDGMPTRLHIRDSVIAENGAGNIYIVPFLNGISVAATLERVTVRNSTFGVKADGDSQATGQIDVEAFESIASSNSTNGYIAVSNAGKAPVHFKVTRSVAHNNAAFGAVASGAQAFMIVSGSSLARNGTGLSQQSSSTVATYTNNDVNFNNGGSNTSGTITNIPQK